MGTGKVLSRAFLGVAWLLTLLQLLLLLGVALLHLLGLLLMALLHLLLLRVVLSLLRGSLMLGVLLLLELLVLLILFGDQLVLLLLILLIGLGIACVGGSRCLVRLHLGCMGSRCWGRVIGRWMIGCSRFVGGDDTLAAKLCGAGGCGDGRLALVDGRT